MLDKMLFSILDSKFNDKFYNKKMRLNPYDDAPLIGFTIDMKKWINSTIPKAIATKSIILETHIQIW